MPEITTIETPATTSWRRKAFITGGFGVAAIAAVAVVRMITSNDTPSS